MQELHQRKDNVTNEIKVTKAVVSKWTRVGVLQYTNRKVKGPNIIIIRYC